jgi:hypothetical protein
MRRRLTYANVISTLALFVALGGGAYASAVYLPRNSVGTKQLKDGAVSMSKIQDGAVSTSKIQDGAVTGAKIVLSSLGKVRRAAHADTASDASSLGGIAAPHYTLSDCGSISGAIKGFVYVGANGAFSSTFMDLPGYNCSTEAIRVRRQAAGYYEVMFQGSPVTLAFGNALVPGAAPNPDVVTFTSNAPGDFYVEVWNTALKAPVDDPFDVVTP